jgi:hypothetical protein
VFKTVSDTNYCFFAVDIGGFGKSSDSSIFIKSTLWKKLTSNKLDISNSVELSGTDKPKAPHIFLTDEALGLTSHVKGPYNLL